MTPLFQTRIKKRSNVHAAAQGQKSHLHEHHIKVQDFRKGYKLFIQAIFGSHRCQDRLRSSLMWDVRPLRKVELGTKIL